MIKALAVSKIKDDCTFVAAASPVLHTRAPTGNIFGPTFSLLLSSPTTFHVMGVIVRAGAKTAVAGSTGNDAKPAVPAAS